MEKFIQNTARVTGLHLNAHQVRSFQLYEKELLTWNEKINLTAIKDPEAIRTKHFLDSLTAICEMNNPTPGRLVDVGTGAGFPGIPLKIMLPELKLTLVESVGKKAEFCRHMVEVLKLENVEVLTARAEDLGQQTQHREKYDWAVARAVSQLPALVEYLLPLVRVGGGMVAQKGEHAHAEVQSAEKAIRLLGGNLRRVSPVMLPGVVEERYLVVIDKKGATPPQYPRRAGLPAKKPL